MGSWIQCLCGAFIHTNLFTGTDVYRLLKDSEYDSLDDPVDRDKLETLFFTKGIPVYRCKECGRLVVEWDNESAPLFYLPEEKNADNSTIEAITTQSNQDDDQRLKELEDIAEAEYDEMYNSMNPTVSYSRAKEAFNDAIAFANIVGRQVDVARLEKRLQHVKDVFRNQFTQL
jgi:hypothetical protein